MQKGDRIGGTFWLIFSLVVAKESYKLGLGTIHSPDAGFLPFWASIILGALSLILLISVIRKKPRDSGLVEEIEDISFNKESTVKVLCVATSLFIYAIILNTLGFILDTAILIGFLLLAIEAQKWYVVILGMISVPLIAHLIFDVFLKVNLPKGLLGF